MERMRRGGLPRDSGRHGCRGRVPHDGVVQGWGREQAHGGCMGPQHTHWVLTDQLASQLRQSDLERHHVFQIWLEAGDQPAVVDVAHGAGGCKGTGDQGAGSEGGQGCGGAGTFQRQGGRL